ncbi:MAG: DNA polymerase III subunit delta' [Candidatus Omnitrophica bacterium]|nr:DNA polymerase III subunit delta' [Candidatus Omnitrophota bacterium]MBU4149139.1 DNA polymerase III subunit delta' [Candidatus Omnitrophota bacterium]
MSFQNIIGQDTAIKALKGIIAERQVIGSYIFMGPDGVGKRTTAIALAKAINCIREVQEGACDCASCKKIDSGNHPDVFVILPEGKRGAIKIGKIRDVIYEASLKPYEGKKRVFIINDAEAMTEEAQNALLKVLEEPPDNHILILTSCNLAGVLPTALSRCKVLKFYNLSRDEIQPFLKSRGAEDKEAVLFSHMAMGSLGRAMAFKEKNMMAKRDRLVNNFFFRKSALLHEDLLTEDMGDDKEEGLNLLLCWYRDMLVSKFTQEDKELFNIDRSVEISSYAQRFSKEKLERDISAIVNTIGYIKRNVNPKIALFDMAVELKRS